MTGEELKKRGFIYFEGIREGLETFEHQMAVMDSQPGLCPFFRAERSIWSR